MSEMVERVARAIYERNPYTESGENIDGFQVTPGGALTLEQLQECDDGLYELVIDQACAAIEAMRAPTENMLKAAAATRGMKRVDDLIKNAFARTQVDTLASECADGSPLQQAWRAAVDEALR